MKLIIILICAYATFACNMEQIFKGKRMKNIIDTEEVEYAKNYVVPEMTRFCQDKRSEGSEFNFDYEPSRRACENIVEGLDKLQHGVSKYHFMSGSQDTEPKHDKVFDFTCYGRIGAPLTTYHDQLVPPEIKELDSAASVLYEKHVVTRESFTNPDTFKEDVNQHNPNKMHLSDLSALDLTLNDKMHSAAYMAVNVKLFHTKLRANIHPTEEILADFNNLPKFSPNTVMDYLWFFRTYGSHLHYASYYGGQFLVLIYHNKNSGNETKTRLPDPLAINALINEALSTEKGSETKVSVFSTGGTADKHQVETWISSVAKNPIPITYHFMPIHLFLTKGNNSSRSTGCEKMEKFEENVNYLKRVLFEVRSFPPVNSLGKYVKELLSSEIDHVCPSEQIVSFAKAGISEAGNVYLNKFYIACMYYKDQGDDSIVQRKILYLIPGLCVNIRSKITKCNQMYFNTPENRNCFVFYEDENCDSKKSYYYIRIFDDAYNMYQKMKSMRLCDLNE